MKNGEAVKYMDDDQLREIWERLGKDDKALIEWLNEDYPDECESCKVGASEITAFNP